MIYFVPPEKLWQVWGNDFDNVVREPETLQVAFNESVTNRVWGLQGVAFIFFKSVRMGVMLLIKPFQPLTTIEFLLVNVGGGSCICRPHNLCYFI